MVVDVIPLFLSVNSKQYWSVLYIIFIRKKCLQYLKLGYGDLGDSFKESQSYQNVGIGCSRYFKHKVSSLNKLSVIQCLLYSTSCVFLRDILKEYMRCPVSTSNCNMNEDGMFILEWRMSEGHLIGAQMSDQLIQLYLLQIHLWMSE